MNQASQPKANSSANSSADRTGMTSGKISLLSRCLLLLATGISLYLAWVSYSTAGLSACGEGGGCDAVLSSKWSKFFNLPVALFGALTYLTAAFFGPRALTGQLSSTLCRGILVTMFMIPLAALWFLIVQAAIIKSFCPLCCSAHFAGTLGVITLFIAYRRQKKSAHQIASPFSPATALLAFGSIGAFALIQSAAPEPEGTQTVKASKAILSPSQDSSETSALPAHSPPVPQVLSLHDGEFSFPLSEVPLLGSPSAEHAIVVIGDYTCGHCRKLHHTVTALQAKHGDDQLAVLQLPGFKNQKSLALAKTLLPLWKGHRETYLAIDQALHQGTLIATQAAVLEEAHRALGGKEVYQAAIEPHRKWANELIQKSARLFHKNGEKVGRRVIPQLMVGDEIVVGFSTAQDRYPKLVTKHFDLPLFSLPDSALALKKSQPTKKSTAPAKPVALGKKSSPAPPAQKPTSQVAKATPSGFVGPHIPNPAGKAVSYRRDENGIHYDHARARLAHSSLPAFGSAADSNLALLILDFHSPESRREALRLIELQSDYQSDFSLALVAASPTSAAKKLHQALAELWLIDSAKYRLTITELLKADRTPSAEEIAQLVSSHSPLQQTQKSQVATYLAASQKIFLANRRLSGRAPVPHLLIEGELFTRQIASVSPLSAFAGHRSNNFPERLTQSP